MSKTKSILQLLGVIYLAISYYNYLTAKGGVLILAAVVGAIISFMTGASIDAIIKKDSSTTRKKLVHFLVYASLAVTLILIAAYFIAANNPGFQSSVLTTLVAIPIIAGAIGAIAYGKVDPF